VASLSQGRTAAAQCGLFTHKSVPVIFEPPCIYDSTGSRIDVVSIILWGSENISLDTNLVMYINNTNIPPIIIINRIYMGIKILMYCSSDKHTTVLLLVSIILFLWIVDVLFT